ncbi:WD40-repeat-containing domain protein, partial [Entophlyctis helioformis]
MLRVRGDAELAVAASAGGPEDGQRERATSTSKQQQLQQLVRLFAAASLLDKQQVLVSLLDACRPTDLQFLQTELARRTIQGVDFISKLPVELAFQILGLLDLCSLGRASQVCKRWNTNADASAVWETALETLVHGSSPSFSASSQIRSQSQGWIAKPDWAKHACKAVCLRDRTWRLYRPIRSERYVHGGKVLAMRIRDGLLVSGSYDRTCSVWNAKDNRTNTFETHAISCVDIYPSQGIVATGSFIRDVKIWDALTGACLQSHSLHLNAVMSLCMDDTFVYSGGSDCMLVAWNWRQESYAGSFTGHHGKISGVCVPAKVPIFTGIPSAGGPGNASSPPLPSAPTLDDDLLFSSSYDRQLRVWNKRTFKSLAAVQFDEPILCMDVTRGVVAVGMYGSVAVLTYSAATIQGVITVSLSPMKCLDSRHEQLFGRGIHHVALNDKYLAVNGQTLSIWRIKPLVHLQKLMEREFQHHQGSLAMDRDRVVFGDGLGRLQVFDFSLGPPNASPLECLEPM